MKLDEFFKTDNKSKIQNFINYKDVFIILSLWYLIYYLTKIIINFQITKHSPNFEGILDYALFTSGRFIFLALTLFYFISIYNLKIKDFKLNLKLNLKFTLQIFFIIIFLTIIIIFLINMPLSLNNFPSQNFDPLYNIQSPANFINSLIPYLLFFISNVIVVLGEIFILENIFKIYLANFLGEKIAILFSAVFYPFLLNITSILLIIQYILLAFIYFILIKKNKNIIYAAFLGSSFYTLIIIYIYGWNIFYIN